jgi:predicted O-methyltransferase YrrM
MLVVDLKCPDQCLEANLGDFQLFFVDSEPAQAAHQLEAVFDLPNERAGVLVVDDQSEWNVAPHLAEELDGTWVLVVVNQHPLFPAAD